MAPKPKLDVHETSLPTPSNYALFDYSPFVHTPAVKAASIPIQSLDPILKIVTIPETQVPSPLAPDIAPSTIKDLRDHLLGADSRTGGNGPASKRGRETWESWKRAWDLWNNHFIEGRVNPIWVKKEYDRLKEATEAYRNDPDDPKNPNPNQCCTGNCGNQNCAGYACVANGVGCGKGCYEDGCPFQHTSPIVNQVPTPPLSTSSSPMTQSMSIKKVRFAFPGVPSPRFTTPQATHTPGYEDEPIPDTPHLCMNPNCKGDTPGCEFGVCGNEGTLIPNFAVKDFFAKKPEDTATRTWKMTGKRKQERQNTGRRVRTKPVDGGSTPVRFEQRKRMNAKGPNYQGKAGDTVYHTARRPMYVVETELQTISVQQPSLKPWSQVVRDRQDGVTSPPILKDEETNESTETVEKAVRVRRMIMQKVNVDIQVEALQSPLTSWATLQKDRADGKDPDPPFDPATQKAKYRNERPLRWIPVEEEYPTEDKPTRILEKDETVCCQEVESYQWELLSDEGDLEDEMEPVEMTEWESVEKPPKSPQRPDHRPYDPTPSGWSQPAMRRKDEVLKYPCPCCVLKCGDNGESGGFTPMKNLESLREPPFNADGDYPEWFDSVQNTVWRPRNLGERHPQFSIDQTVQHFLHKSKFENDGGVDCGRSPYPVLRPLIKSYLTPNSCFRKTKEWDNVTGTLFNMPTLPDSHKETPTERMKSVKLMYGDFFRDERDLPRNDLFPLDIRRCNRVDPKTGLRKGVITDLLTHGESRIVYPWQDGAHKYPQFQDDDPWKVTEAQEIARDVPRRRYPPVKEADLTGKYLAVDDSNWVEEVAIDEDYDSRYFVTNLHGGTLIINGQDVKKGVIAGPLPPFAVIETQGGQISFWWGIGGRNWGSGPHGINFSLHWETLRRTPGLEHIGMIAGQVWDLRIRDRLKREYSRGEAEEDDEDWTEWKAALPPTPPKLSKPLDDKFPQLELTIFRGTADEPSLCDRKQQEYPHPEFFISEEAELKWLHTRAQPLHLVWKQGQVNTLYLDYMSCGESFFPGSRSIEDVLPEIKEQKLAEASWKRSKDRILRDQATLVRTIQRQNDDRLVKKKEKEDAENAVIKANTPTPTDPEVKRIAKQQRADTRNEILRRTIELQVADEELEEEKQKLEWEQLQQAAAIGALTRDIDCPGKKKLIEEQFHRDQQRIQHLKQAKWTQMNVDRAARGIQPLPPLQHANTSIKLTEQLANIAKRQAEADKIAADARAARQKIANDKMADDDRRAAQQAAEIAVEQEKARRKVDEAQRLARATAAARAQKDAQNKQDTFNEAAATAAVAANQRPRSPTIVPGAQEPVHPPASLPQTAAEKAFDQKRIEIANTAAAALLNFQEDLKKARQAAAAKYLATRVNNSTGVISGPVIQRGLPQRVQPVAPRLPRASQKVIPPSKTNTASAPLQPHNVNSPQVPPQPSEVVNYGAGPKSPKTVATTEVDRSSILNLLRTDLKAACRRGTIARWRITLDPKTNAPYPTIGEYLRTLTDEPVALDLDTYVENYALSKMTMGDMPIIPSPQPNKLEAGLSTGTGDGRWERANRIIFDAEDWDAQNQSLERWTIPVAHSGSISDPNGDPSTYLEL